MKINYVTVLKNKLGIVYDILFQGIHINMTMCNGLIDECVTIESNGDHSDSSIGTKSDISMYLVMSRR